MPEVPVAREPAATAALLKAVVFPVLRNVILRAAVSPVRLVAFRAQPAVKASAAVPERPTAAAAAGAPVAFPTRPAAPTAPAVGTDFGLFVDAAAAQANRMIPADSPRPS